MMTKELYRFQAPEYQADGSFVETSYSYEGNEQEGWIIRRRRSSCSSSSSSPDEEGKEEVVERLGAGYTALSTLYCGVCSTDLARRFLPYPLPQIIGHEVVAVRKPSSGEQQQQQQPVVVEINASYLARGIATPDDPYNNMTTQDPRRITLGINRLPGGFAPVLLAPIHAVVDVPPSIPPKVAALTEPFAAALQGVEATHPRAGQRVAVLGPRRLGCLLISALAGFRHRTGIDFEIVAVARHEHLLALAKALGADTVINTSSSSSAKANGELQEAFDIVFDTTGKPEGFADALQMTRRGGVLHLKSTNGQEVMGVGHLTDMVVDELALIPYHSNKDFDFTWPLETETNRRANPNIYVAPGVSDDLLVDATNNNSKHTLHRLDVKEAEERIETASNNDSLSSAPSSSWYPPSSPFARFDLAIASNLAEVDAIVRPTPGKEFSILRARGAILLTANSASGAGHDEKHNGDNSLYDSPLHKAVVERGISIHTSRCGNFRRAIDVLDASPDMVVELEKQLITHCFPLDDIDGAFAMAADSEKSVKVVVETGRLHSQE